MYRSPQCSVDILIAFSFIRKSGCYGCFVVLAIKRKDQCSLVKTSMLKKFKKRKERDGVRELEVSHELLLGDNITSEDF